MVGFSPLRDTHNAHEHQSCQKVEQRRMKCNSLRILGYWLLFGFFGEYAETEQHCRDAMFADQRVCKKAILGKHAIGGLGAT
jgi:hypothetical protein